MDKIIEEEIRELKALAEKLFLENGIIYAEVISGVAKIASAVDALEMRVEALEDEQ
jgi:hypothetical protein